MRSHSGMHEVTRTEAHLDFSRSLRGGMLGLLMKKAVLKCNQLNELPKPVVERLYRYRDNPVS